MVPSEEVRMVPDSPPATNVLFPKVTPHSSFVVPEVLEVHVVPSGEVKMVPVSLSPTATNVLFPYVTPQIRPVVPEVLEVQVVASVEVRMVPDPPTVTNVLFA